MSDKSAIEWTDASWNPVTGCTKVSPGCANCYIERTPPFRMNGRKFERGTTGVMLHPERLDLPLRWKKPKRIFVNALSDLFHEHVLMAFIAEVFAVMALTPRHTYQVLTKRPERMLDVLGSRDFLSCMKAATLYHEKALGKRMEQLGTPWALPLPNVWLGVSVENQHWADIRIPLLLQTPAAVRWISAEPLLEAVDLRCRCGHAASQHYEYIRNGHDQPACMACDPFAQRVETVIGVDNDSYDAAMNEAMNHRLDIGLDWVVVGGESGPKRREMHFDWARSIVAQCRAAGTPVFVKQKSGPTPGMPSGDPDLDACKEMPK